MYRGINISDNLEDNLVYLGLLDKAHEIFVELGSAAAVSYIRSSYRLLSKVYHPDLNPSQSRKAQITQQTLNRVKDQVNALNDEQLAGVIRQGIPERKKERKKILVVDDEPMIRDMLKQLLNLEGYDCSTAENADDAFRKYMNDRPDLLISDIVMQGIDGIELVQRLRRVTPKIKVIYICGLLGAGNLRKRIDQDIRTFHYQLLEKPLKPSTLFATIEEQLQIQEGEHTGFFTTA